MEQQLFTDGIGRITVIGGIVRLDLVTYSATETDAKGQARPILTQRLVMGTDAFLRSAEKVLEVVQALTKQANATQPTAQAIPPAPPPAEAPAAQTSALAPVSAPLPALTPANKSRPDVPLASMPRIQKFEQPVTTAPQPMPSPWSKPLSPKLPFP